MAPDRVPDLLAEIDQKFKAVDDAVDAVNEAVLNGVDAHEGARLSAIALAAQDDLDSRARGLLREVAEALRQSQEAQGKHRLPGENAPKNVDVLGSCCPCGVTILGRCPSCGLEAKPAPSPSRAGINEAHIREQLEVWDRGEDYSNEVTDTVRLLLDALRTAQQERAEAEQAAITTIKAWVDRTQKAEQERDKLQAVVDRLSEQNADLVVNAASRAAQHFEAQLTARDQTIANALEYLQEWQKSDGGNARDTIEDVIAVLNARA